MKKVIGIYCGGGSSLQTWDDEVVREKGAGGSETWAVEIASEFQRRGFHVIVFGYPAYWRFAADGVEYVPISNFNWRCEYQHFDYFIFSRTVPKDNSQLNCPNIYVAVHDPCIFDMTSESFSFKKIGYLSQWQKEQIQQTTGIFNDMFYFKVRNGVDMSLYSGADFSKKEDAMVWSTVPERGFGFFMQNIFPAIKRAVPTFQVYCCSYTNGGFDKYKGIDGVKFLPLLGKKDLADIQKRCKIWVYPNIGPLEMEDVDIPIHETFCLSAVENAIAKNAIITTWNTGLKDTLYGYDYLFGKGEIECGNYTQEVIENSVSFFVNMAIKALTNDTYRKEMVLQSEAICKKYTWKNAADDWLKEWGYDA